MIDSSRLVDQQLRLVELKRALEGGQHTGAKPGPAVRSGPCVVISREYGSVGDALAQCVGLRLHWQVFDHEIVTQIAERAHVRQQLVESVDEQVRWHWQRLLHPIREREGLKPATYLYHLHEIILALGHHGYVVIVGRGAQYLLPDEGALRVRVVEPFADRVRRVATVQQLPEEEARLVVQKHDTSRSNFIRKGFHEDARSVLSYDLVLNAGLWSLESGTATLLSALEKKLGIKPEPVSCAK
jgi:hypothetical protein